MEQTTQQLAIYKAINAGTQVFVDAKAGTGKTTTIIHAVTEACPSPANSTLLVAFNAQIKKELERRVGSAATVKTYHGLGYSAWAKYLGQKLEVRADKAWEISKAVCKRMDIGRSVYTVKRIAETAITSRLFPEGTEPMPKRTQEDTPENWLQCGLAALDGETPTNVEIQAARQVVKLSVQQAFQGKISFDEMVIMPILFSAPFTKYQRVYGDEFQDTNADNMEQIARSMSRNGQLIAVGDPNQAIYAFRGADLAAVDTAIQRFSLEKFPLSVSWRCGREIIAHAQELVPGIEAAPNAHEGEVLFDVEDPPAGPGDLILARTNAKLISKAFRLIRQKTNIKVLGHDVAKGIKNLITSFKVSTNAELREAIHTWEDIQRVNHEGKRPAKLERLLERSETILAFMDEGTANTVDELLDEISFLFARSGKTILSTIHRAKGLEAENVTIIQPAGCNEWFMKNGGEQEVNLDYVSRTRAIQSLVYEREEG